MVRSSFIAIVLGLLVPTVSFANPISCDKPGDITIGDDTSLIKVTFKSLCYMGEMADDYDTRLVIQFQDPDGWHTLSGDGWEEDGTAEEEGGSGLMTYTIYAQQVVCPSDGDHSVRLAWYYSDGDDFDRVQQGSVSCDAVESDVEQTSQCAANGEQQATPVISFAALALAALLRRRW